MVKNRTARGVERMLDYVHFIVYYLLKREIACVVDCVNIMITCISLLSVFFVTEYNMAAGMCKMEYFVSFKQKKINCI